MGSLPSVICKVREPEADDTKRLKLASNGYVLSPLGCGRLRWALTDIDEAVEALGRSAEQRETEIWGKAGHAV